MVESVTDYLESIVVSWDEGALYKCAEKEIFKPNEAFYLAKLKEMPFIHMVQGYLL